MNDLLTFKHNEPFLRIKTLINIADSCAIRLQTRQKWSTCCEQTLVLYVYKQDKNGRLAVSRLVLYVYKQDKNGVLIFLIKSQVQCLLSLPNNVWRLIVFAPFLIIIIIILLSFFPLTMNLSTADLRFVVNGVKAIF